ncbi:hypothetical protein C8263_02930 [Deinococcus arcticus]|uniref:Uncharacterized protein n=1 Tax=Deinococcus arcticus TaxID=2136176 RepID=A0A2T3WC32_9DEIO|nr:hypothetical protein C8263_02930 [Deinococcus arcticus]
MWAHIFEQAVHLTNLGKPRAQFSIGSLYPRGGLLRGFTCSDIRIHVQKELVGSDLFGVVLVRAGSGLLLRLLILTARSRFTGWARWCASLGQWLSPTLGWRAAPTHGPDT